MNRQRILVLTPRYPYPVIGGDRLRIYELCRELSKHYDLSLLSLCETTEELEGALPEDGVFQYVERIRLPQWHSFLNVLAALPGRTPLQVAYYKCARFGARARELLTHHDYCLAHLIRTGDYVRHAGVPTVLEMTDAISLNYLRVRSVSAPHRVQSLVYSLEADRLMKYERAVLADFDVVTLVSDVDRNFMLEGREDEHVLVCSNGVNLHTLPFHDRADSDAVIVFVGNLVSIQNLDACFYFAEQVLPLARQKLDWTFRVVGRIKARDANRLGRYAGVEVRANVECVADAVGNAMVGVAPIRIGAGIQNKILEYMSMGLPVITSPIGLEGLAARPGSEILIARTPEEYVAHLTALWRNRLLVSRLGRAGFQYVRQHHNWSGRLAPLLDAIRSLPPHTHQETSPMVRNTTVSQHAADRF